MSFYREPEWDTTGLDDVTDDIFDEAIESLDDKTLRLTALDFALRTDRRDPDSILAIAQRFYDFMAGKEPAPSN